MSASTFRGSAYRPGVVALKKSLGVHSYINNEGGVEYDLSYGPSGRRSKVEVRPNHDDDDDDDDDDSEERELTRGGGGGGAKDKSNVNRSNREAYRRSKELEIHVRKTEGGRRSNGNSTDPLIRDSLKIKNRTFGSFSGSAHGKRIRILCDSDLERILPPGSGWKRLLLTTVIVFCSAVVYVVGMVAILKGIGGY